MISKANDICPECKKKTIKFVKDDISNKMLGKCISCFVTLNYIVFTCDCCCADILDLCDNPECDDHGVPKPGNIPCEL